MAVKPIVLIPNKILEAKCEKVSGIDADTKVLIKDLLDTLRHAHNPEGAGLAAPQIGVLKRVCIARRFIYKSPDPEREIVEELIMINPKIISASKETNIDWEGCLSIPNAYGKVNRANKIKVRATNENGEEVKISASGFLARVIQHEIDHLDGILFTSKLKGSLVTEKELDEIYKEEDAKDVEEYGI
jgi:peptide deformylase